MWDTSGIMQNDDLNNLILEIRDNALSAKTRKAYEDAIVRQLLWFLEFEPQIISDHLRCLFLSEFAELELEENESIESAMKKQKKSHGFIYSIIFKASSSESAFTI